MSAERVVPAASAQAPRVAASPLSSGRTRAMAAAVCAVTIGCGSGPADHVLARRTSADGRLAAEVRLARCGSEWCHTLWIGERDAPTLLATLPATSEQCDEIAWSPDGARAGFLINGAQLRLYDARTHAPAGQIDLVSVGDMPARIARGVTFSENGAAVTFDDCPRNHSGCRPGLVAIR